MARYRAPLAERTPVELVRMRVIAGLLLLAMAALFLVARTLTDRHPVWGFVRAFAEAAMIGGLADWFAVTALFRHPLGLPIPHTAIIPRNKDRIGDSLARFLRANFLVPRVVARRMAGVDLAGAVGRWLARPQAQDGRLRAGAAALAAKLLEGLDQEHLGGVIRATVGQRLRALELSPLLGQAMAAAINDNRHVPLLDGIIGWAAKVLAANEATVRAMIQARAGAVMRFTGLDTTLATKVIEGLNAMLAETATDPDHPLRAKAEEGLATLAHDLVFDPVMRERVEAFKAEIIANPAMQHWLNGIWEQARGGLLRVANDPRAALGGRFGDTLRQLGETLQHNPAMRDTINRYARRTAVGTAAEYGDGIVRLVSETIRAWDARTITRRLENAVGRDLQYIRVNGTVVGGLVGLAIHAVDVLL